MARIELIDIQADDDEAVRDIYEFMAETGRNWDSEHWRLEANFPQVMMHLLRARTVLWTAGGLSRETLEKIAVAVSVANGCPYCTGAFCTHLTDLGFDDAEVAAFIESVTDGVVDGRDAAIIEFALQSLDDPQGVTDRQVRGLRETHGLTDRDLLQVVYVVNIVSGFNRIVDTFDADYDHAFPAELVRERVDVA